MSEKFSVPLNESWSASDETLHRCVFNYEAAYAEGMEPTGRLMLNRSEHLFHILPSVEDFVRLAICDQFPSSDERDLGHGSSIDSVSELAVHRQSIDRYLNIFPSDYSFSEPVMILEECAEDLREHFFGVDSVSSEDRFNFLIEALSKRAAEIKFHKRMRARECRSEGMFSTSKNLVDGLLYEHKKIQVVQVDLGYSTEMSSAIGLVEAKRDFAKFLNLLRNRQVLASNLGYIWTAGYANYRGFYFRLFMFFEEDIGFGTAVLAHYLLDFWTDTVTNGKGVAFPSDDRINPILHAATGVLACDDNIMYCKMMDALRYLAVKEMHLSMKNRGSSRVFGHSHR
ncbi:inovirus-type Gp2 protein [Acidovorax sp.]|jgi:hypothetical protein|uniref:inovirus-type Gp2 protein n=1 Tax=Acidovorax sp. TaxID=1872122 RepID=UPI0027BA740B|nr:inovirus-type Gp2 protein [Acidovorax sp.]